jgi:mannose-6-phosphate isomerase-like protein (cupin superfamily)
MFHTKLLPDRPDLTAPDGSDVRILLALAGGSMAHFELAEGCVSRAVAHRTVEEIWYFLEGLGVMWRKLDGHEETVRVEAGVCLTIPVGTHFQFRSIGPGPLKAVAVTMPPWPGDGEAFEVQGLWKPTK